MRKFVIIMSCLLMAILSIPIMGCSKEFQDFVGLQLSGQKIQLTGSIDGLTITRATEQGFDLGDTIMVFVTYNEGTVKQVLAVYDGEQFIPYEDIYYPVNGSLQLAAFYPYHLYSVHLDTITGHGIFEYGNKISDPLVATENNLNSTNSVVNLKFKHSLSMIKLNIISGLEYLDLVQITGVGDYFAYNYFGELINSGGGNDTLTLEESIIIPQQGNVRLQVRSGDHWYYYSENIPTESGKITNIDISMSPGSLNIIKAQVVPWENGNSVGWDIKL